LYFEKYVTNHRWAVQNNHFLSSSIHERPLGKMLLPPKSINAGDEQLKMMNLSAED
jgi:hypothetical protein